MHKMSFSDVTERCTRPRFFPNAQRHPESHSAFHNTCKSNFKNKKLPPSEITVPALASENIPVSGEHRLVPLTIQTDGLHYGQRVPATLAVVVEGSV